MSCFLKRLDEKSDEYTVIEQFSIHENDVVLQTAVGFKILPGKLDFSKPVTLQKVPKGPLKESERFIKIKSLNDKTSEIAVLNEMINYKGDMLERIEREELRTVKYGEVFHVRSKFQVMDSPSLMTISFMIERE